MTSREIGIALFQQVLQDFGGGAGAGLELLAGGGAAARLFARDFRLLAKAVARGFLGAQSFAERGGRGLFKSLADKGRVQKRGQMVAERLDVGL